MKISHLSKPWLPVPSVAYGAIEKMLAELAISQSKRDDIYLFAPGGSVSSEKINLISLYDEGQIDKNLDRNTELAQAVDCAIKSSDLNVDIIHAHSVDPFLGLIPFLKIPSIFTFYSNPTQANKQLSNIAQENTTFTFLSNSHRKSFPWIKKAEVIYFGVDARKFPFLDKKQDYLAFVGSISDKKGIIEAIEISKMAGVKLKIAAKVRDEDRIFYENEIKSLISKSENVQYLGELNNESRNELLKNAKAMLFPIKWEEPLGMVMIESMVVGTPVIAFNRGSVPEVVVDSKTGFIVENVYEAAKSIKKLNNINSFDCRKHIEDHFNIEKTTGLFKSLYSRVLRTFKLNSSIV